MDSAATGGPNWSNTLNVNPRSNSRESRNARLDADLEAIRQAEVDGTEVEDTDAGVRPVQNDPWEKRYADLRSFSAKKEKEFRDELNAVKAQLNDATKKQIKFPKSEEEVEDWIKKYPDVAGIVETIALKKVAEVRKEIDERDQALQLRAHEFDKEKAFNKLLAAHPDFLDIREDDKFHDWVEGQVKWIRDSLYTNDTDADSAIAAIDLFKAKTGYGQEKPKKKDTKADTKDAARGVNRPSPARAPADDNGDMILESEVARMSIKEYSARKAEIEKAIREGKFDYDLSGAAR